MPSIDPAAIPNRFDFAQTQARIYREWEERGFFHAEPPKAGEPDEFKGPYAIVIPPPNVTGALHLGHALNNTLQDIQIRLHRMQGYNTLWMPGTDHAGIATQAVVERRLREEENKTRHDLGRDKLVERIWEWKEQYETRILNQLKQMGCSCDWQRTRFTLDDVCARAVRQTFFDLFSKGLIYRGKRLVNWDTFLQTAVSDDEVFQETVKGHFWHFRYPVVSLETRCVSEGEPQFIEIATTRPETMLGDTAVAVHPDPAGALDKAEAELRERLEKAPAKEKDSIQVQIDNIQKRRTEMLPLLLQLAAMAKAGRKIMLPLVNREIPLICDEWAKPELGTGAVKITPAHDPNDYEVWQRHKEIGAINILNPDGTLNENAGPYKGLTIPKARERVVADLEKLGLLGDVEDRDIELPHSDRSKTPIEPYLADQWFVKMSDIDTAYESEGRWISETKPGLAQMAMDAVSSPHAPREEPKPLGDRTSAGHISRSEMATKPRVNILPPRYAKSYLDWLSEKRDWPVSRQLWWGHRIPIWSKPFQGKVQRDEVRKLATTFNPDGENESFAFYESWDVGRYDPEGIAKVEGNGFICLAEDDPELTAKIEAAGFQRDPDVLDTWFSSALWPHSTLGWPEQTDALKYWYPTSVLITSRDIITLWVARMVLMGLNNMGEVPFREVFIHPKILDGYGETMSKSKGNGVDPLDIIDKFGADSLRFGLTALTTETQDVRMPVQFECPHCQALIDQTKKNRELPIITCTKCRKGFSTQWARSDADKALPRAAVVSERFEVARNFMNKLWNASRFVLMNLDGTGDRGQESGGRSQETGDRGQGTGSTKYSVLSTQYPAPATPSPAPSDQPNQPSDHSPLTTHHSLPAEHHSLLLTTEDRWLLSRLATLTKGVTEALEHYHYADAARLLYDFAWDEFCSFYVEIAKARLTNEIVADADARSTVQAVLAHALDTLLRLLHPIMPFITEEVWQLLNQVAPLRGLDDGTRSVPATEWLIAARWPVADLRWQDSEIEARFAIFQQALGAIREIRSRQNIATRDALEFCIQCDALTAQLLEPMRPYFQSMTNATALGLGPNVTIPPTHAKSTLAGLEIYVDLKDFIDVAAELAKNEQQEQKLLALIKAKEGKLANESFVSRAPASVVQAERDGLAQLQEQLASVRATLQTLRK